jgi:hypothetical protein
MRRVLVIALCSLSFATGPSASGAAQDSAQLSIAVYPQGRGSLPVHHYSLRCDPAQGTVPHPLRACRTLAGLAHPFAPVPAGTICNQVALGPQEAVVTGSVRRRPVDTHLSLRNGCEIARWRRLRTVVPGFPIQ